MAYPLPILEAIRNRDEAAIEAAWLEHLATDAHDVEAFAQAGESLEAFSPDLARVLLELVDEELRQQGLWDHRLELIKRAGRWYLKSGTVHATVMETLSALYGAREEALAVLMPAVGLDKSRDETPKLWDKVERLRNLLTYEIGTVVAMKDKGVGTVVDVNLQLQTLKVDFERAKGVAVGFRAAGKMLELLDDDHILKRKLEEPKALRELPPPELLRIVLESYDRPLTGAEIKSALHGLVKQEKWSSWWAAARKHPQVLLSTEGRRAYSWASTSEDAGAQQWRDFEEADLAGQLDQLRRSLHADESVREKMVAALSAELDRRQESDPATAFEIWIALERQPVEIDWQPADTLAAHDDPVGLITSIDSKPARQRAYQMLRDRREDWPERYAEALEKEEDPRQLQVLGDALAKQSRERFEKAALQIFRRFRSHPAAFVYLAEKAARDEPLLEKRPLRLLKQILSALAEDRFKPFHSRLQKLAESGGTLPRLFPHLREEDAKAAREAIEKARGLADHDRRPLLNALDLKFPSLRKADEQPLYTTQPSLDQKREELRALLEEEIPANRRAIQEAREMGDLRENFEYKSARQRHEYLSARASQLNRDLERARLLDASSIDPSEVRIGTRLRLENEDGERDLTILGPWESAPEEGIISFESELAKEILGKKPGDKIALDGTEYEIAEIALYE